MSQKEYLCPSGALAPLVGKGSVLSCRVSGLCVSGLEIALSHSSGSCLGHAHCTGKPTCGRHQHSQKPFRDLPNRTGGFTTCHSREHIREFSQPAQGIVFFPNVFLEKAKHPTHRRSGKINGYGLDEASARGIFCAVMSWETSGSGGERSASTKKEAVGFPESWPLGTVILEAKITWAHLGGSRRDKKNRVSQSFTKGKRRAHSQPGKAALNRFGDLKNPRSSSLCFQLNFFLMFI